MSTVVGEVAISAVSSVIKVEKGRFWIVGVSRFGDIEVRDQTKTPELNTCPVDVSVFYARLSFFCHSCESRVYIPDCHLKKWDV